MIKTKFKQNRFTNMGLISKSLLLVALAVTLTNCSKDENVSEPIDYSKVRASATKSVMCDTKAVEYIKKVYSLAFYTFEERVKFLADKTYDFRRMCDYLIENQKKYVRPCATVNSEGYFVKHDYEITTATQNGCPKLEEVEEHFKRYEKAR